VANHLKARAFPGLTYFSCMYGGINPQAPSGKTLRLAPFPQNQRIRKSLIDMTFQNRTARNFCEAHLWMFGVGLFSPSAVSNMVILVLPCSCNYPGLRFSRE